jgi:SPP1 gp7 family putative phage head morphogenesis protein
MPFSKRQINRILDEQGRPVIALGRSDHLTLRVSESYLRRKLYAWEDRAVSQQWDTFDTAFKHVREFASNEAAARNLTTPGRDRATLHWKAAVKQYAAFRLKQAMDKTAREGFAAALTAWYAGYYGNAWALDMLTPEAVRVNVPAPRDYDAHEQVLMPRLQEQVLSDRALYDLLGADFRAQHETELAEMLVRINRVLDNGVNTGQSQSVIFKAVREAMGIQTDRRSGFTKNFHKVQTITRTAVMQAANDGNMAVYQQNADLVGEVEFLSSNDGRVCVLCAGLDGTRWPLGDLGVRIPPGDTHPNCRCTLVPILNTDTVPADTAPRLTMGEWLTVFGAGYFLSDFLGVQLGSTQV